MESDLQYTGAVNEVGEKGEGGGGEGGGRE